MLNKTNHPKIEVKDWINVEGSECLITQVYGGWSLSGACEVVCDPENPVNLDVYWDGQQWLFSTRPSFINATKTSRLKEFVTILQQQKES